MAIKYIGNVKIKWYLAGKHKPENPNNLQFASSCHRFAKEISIKSVQDKISLKLILILELNMISQSCWQALSYHCMQLSEMNWVVFRYSESVLFILIQEKQKKQFQEIKITRRRKTLRLRYTLKPVRHIPQNFPRKKFFSQIVKSSLESSYHPVQGNDTGILQKDMGKWQISTEWEDQCLPFPWNNPY